MHMRKNVLLIGQILAQVSADQRERMTMSVERLNQSGDRIKESRRTMLETEELGVSILEDLHQQRQTLLHAHNKVLHLIFFSLKWTIFFVILVNDPLIQCVHKYNRSNEFV